MVKNGNSGREEGNRPKKKKAQKQLNSPVFAFMDCNRTRCEETSVAFFKIVL